MRTLEADVTEFGALIELLQWRRRLQIWIWTETQPTHFEPALMFSGTHLPTAQATYDAFCGKRRRKRSRDLHPSGDE